MQFSNRLKKIGQMVNVGAKIADIGCDHAYTSIYLVQMKKVEKVIAMDVREGPLQKAREHISRFGLSEKIELRLSDGCDALKPGEVDTLLLSGMGGRLIGRILSRGNAIVEQCATLIVQPQSELAFVRKYLRELGFAIIEESMLLEAGKYYNILKAQKQKSMTKRPAKEQELFDRYGAYLLQNRDPVLRTYLKKEMEQNQMLFIRLKGKDTISAKKRLLLLEEERVWLEKGLSYDNSK